MILLLTACPRSREYAAAIERATGHKIQTAAAVAQAIHRLEHADFDVLVIDQSLLEAGERSLDRLLSHAGIAMPLYVNLALHGDERVVREIQAALLRAEKEKLSAMRAAERVLRTELRDDVTALLLTSGLALRQTALPPETARKVRCLQEMAERLRVRLQIA